MLTLMLTVNGSSDSANFDADANANAHCEWTLTGSQCSSEAICTN